MKRFTGPALILALCSVAAITANAWTEQPPQEVIEIKVSPQDLAACQTTLAQVAVAPAVSDDGSPIWLSAHVDADLPAVVCVAVSS